MINTTNELPTSKEFVSKLVHIAKNDLKSLAALRRGIDGNLQARVEAYGIVCRIAPKGSKTVYMAVASLFARHPKHTLSPVNFGHSCRLLANDKRTLSMGKRFDSLVKASRLNLPRHIRNFIPMLKSAGIPINYVQLLEDLMFWGKSWESAHRQKSWVEAFYS